jgi:hypothetical protein
MPRKTETIHTEYRGLTADGQVVKESRYLNTVKRYMRPHPDGVIEQRDLVGYYTPWTPTKKDDQ